MDLSHYRAALRLVNLRDGRQGWYSVARNSAGPSVVTIYDEVGFFGVTAQSFMDEVSDLKGDLELHLNSPGGEIFDGIAIYTALRQRKGDIAVYVDSLAASIATVIAMAASPGKLVMARNSSMMIHDGHGAVDGDAATLRKTADVLDRMSDEIASVYADRSGKPATHWRAAMREETWYNAQQAVDAGLADRAEGEPRNSFGALMNSLGSLTDAATAPYVSATQTRHIPTTITHAHDHSAFGHGDHDDGVHTHMHTHTGDASHDHSHESWDPDGDGDDDSRPETDTDHSHWTSDGRPRFSPGEYMRTDVHSLRGAWDGNAAMSRAGSAKDPAAAFRSICAGEHTTGTSDQRQHWALPHHDNAGGPPVEAGVRNALSQLPKTKNLKSETSARNHLHAHMHEINPDWEPDDVMSVDLGDWDPSIFRAAFRADGE